MSALAVDQGRRPRAAVPTPGWVNPARAPQLRRWADQLEARAAGSDNPLRVLRLARDCRLRAAELEAGVDVAGDLLGDRDRPRSGAKKRRAL